MVVGRFPVVALFGILPVARSWISPEPTPCADDDAGAIEVAKGFAMKVNGCADVRVYCDDPKLGSIARQVCPFTCGVCQVAGCLVTDGTDLSSAYPCACGSRTCFTNVHFSHKSVPHVRG
ncbi:unnamed protein product [Prorocentrum cordatum]|uniref:ShKT domain-containing protein n=1 Tax=Prorocentrum cordatum TaxID=2364126 RepID=A0ABN9PBF2_9DINO|nr:unnamed protein product [Polarella glacialis]